MLNLKGLLLSGFPVLAIILNLPLLTSAIMAQPAIAQSSLSWQGVVNTILGRREPKPPGQGRRGSPRPAGLCLLAPVDNLWNTNPTFIWSGEYRIIGMREQGAQSDLWWTTATTQPQSVMSVPYAGTTLVPGKIYEWAAFTDQNRRSPLGTVSFQILNEPQRTTITKGLQALESRLKAQNASEEAIALQRANYFATKGLQADALQEIYSVKHPSAELKQVMRDIEKQLCQSQE